jgi:protease-4
MDQQSPTPPQFSEPKKEAVSDSKARPLWFSLSVILGLSALFFAIFVGITGTLMLGDFREDDQDHSAIGSKLFSEGGVGIIELEGVIMDSKRFLKQLRKFEENPQVKAVVVRLDSPGGSVAPSQEIYDAVKRFPKPLVASMGSVAASGAFYVSCGAKKVFANPGTLTGSIGVIMEFANLSKLYEWAKVERYSLKTGKYKDSGADYRPMDPESRELLQNVINGVLDQFKQAVVEGRKLSPEEVTQVADGRILSGAQALQLKLVDAMGGIEDAVAEAAKLGGIEGKPRWIYPRESRASPLMDLFLLGGEEEEAESRSNLTAGLVGAVVGGVEKVAGSGVLPPGIYWVWRSGVGL